MCNNSDYHFGKNGNGFGINSQARLPENEQVQYLQKIAIAKNKYRPEGFSARSAIFCCHWGSKFSGQVSAIGARDEAIFTKISIVVQLFPLKHCIYIP